MKRYLPFLFFVFQLSCQLPQFDLDQGEINNLKVMMRGMFEDTFNDLISDPVFGYEILKDPFYYYTKPPRKRDIVGQLGNSLGSGHKTVTLFYHETTEGVFSYNKTALGDYVDITQNSLIEELESRIPPGVDIPEVLPLFAPVSIQERRVGLFFVYDKQFYEWNIKFKLPVMYQEYNFYLTPGERAAIANADLFQPRKTETVAIEDGPKEKPQGQGVKEFAKSHLLSDKFGIGDMHITFEKELKAYNHSSVFGGFDITLPTAFAFKKGVVGAYFNKKRANPVIDLHDDIVDLYGDAEYDQMKQNALDFGVAALDRLSTIVLEHPLGNGRHPGIAPFIKLQLNIKDGVMAHVQLKTDFLVPVTEQRFFKTKVDSDALDALADLDDLTEDEARTHVNFLNEQLVKKLFPKSYSTVVFPGIIFQSDVMLLLKTRKWTFECGFQSWMQSSEKFISLPRQAGDLEIEQGRRHAALQNKICFGILKEGSTTAFELKIAGTPLSYAIGKTILVTLACTWEF